jgi:hypothetical protein
LNILDFTFYIENHLTRKRTNKQTKKMNTTLLTQPISNLTVQDLKTIIEEIIERKLSEYSYDLDAGLELRPEVAQELERSMRETSKGIRGTDATEVSKRLGLSW